VDVEPDVLDIDAASTCKVDDGVAVQRRRRRQGSDVKVNDKVVEVNDCVKAAATLARRWASSSATIFTTSAILFEVLCGVHAATGLGVLERAVQ
jgi:hypothetical protein